MYFYEKILNHEIDLDSLLQCIIAELKTSISYITNSTTNVLKKNYLKGCIKKTSRLCLKIVKMFCLWVKFWRFSSRKITN